jgi:hypothetical protein
MYTIADLSREYLERLPFQAQHQPAASSSAAAHSRTSAHDDAGQDAANRTSGGAETFGRREFGSEEGGGSGGDGGLVVQWNHYAGCAWGLVQGRRVLAQAL